MRSRAVLLIVALAIAALLPGAVEAQNARETAARGIAAYQAVRYDNAAPLLRQALETTGSDALSDSARAVVAAYLAATELFRNRHDAAAAAVRQALAADPAYRPDTLAFPPKIAEAFESVRRSTRFVRVRAPSDTTIQPGGRGYPVRLVVSAPHEITAALLPERGTPQVFYQGTVADTAVLTWPAFDRRSAPPEGRFQLEIRSRLPGGGTRVVRLPLEARAIRPDTVPTPPPPPDSAFRPEYAPRRSAVPAVSLGLMAGAVTMLLPTVVAKDGIGSRTRYVLGGALSVAGIVAFFNQSRGDPLPENTAANRALVDQWRREAEAARAENERRRGRTALRVIAGRQSTSEGTQ
jgi:hypothetical protein